MYAASAAALLSVFAICSAPPTRASRLPLSTRLSALNTAVLSSTPPTLFAFTTQGTLLAIDVESGAVHWSRRHSGSLSESQLTLCGDVLVASNSRSIEALAATSGKLLWQRHEGPGDEVAGPHRLSCERRSPPALLSTLDSTLRRLDPSSGAVTAEISLAKDSFALVPQSDSLPFQVVEFGEKVASLLKMGPKDGSSTVVATFKLPKRPRKPEFEQVLTSPSSGRSTYLWVEESRLHSLDLADNSSGTQTDPVPGLAHSLVGFGFEDRGISVVSRKDGTSSIIRLLPSGKIEEVWKFNRPSGPARFSTVLDVSGTLHIARLSWSRTLQLSTVDIVSLSLKGEASSPIVSGQTIPVDLESNLADNAFSFALHATETGKLLPDFTAFVSSPAIALQAWNGSSLLWEAESFDKLTKNRVNGTRTLVTSPTSIGMVSGERTLWRHRIGSNERIEKLAAQSSDTMLSPGRVNADRTSVLKYRNSDAIAVAVSTSSADLSLRLLSMDNGHEVGRFELPFKVDRAAAVGIALVEDWVVCTFRTTSLDVPMYILVSTYLSQPSSSGVILPRSRIFASPKAYHVEGFTRSKLGIASRDCLLTDSLGQLTVLPRRLLNPLTQPLGAKAKIAGTDDLLEILPTGKTVGRSLELSGIERVVALPGHRESEASLVSPGPGGFDFVLRPSGSFDALSDTFSRTQVVAVLGILLSSLLVARSTARRRAVSSNWSE